MSDTSVKGPSWTPRTVTLEDGTLATILTMPDTERDITYVLSSLPRLVHGPMGGPIFSLSLVLSSPPGPDRENVHALIMQGVLSMDVQIGVSPAELDALAVSGEGEFRRLFARRIDYCLLWQESADAPPLVLACEEGGGTEGRAGLSAQLERQQSIEALGALDGMPSRLRLRAEIHYRAPGRPQVVHISGSWAAIHDFLSTYQDAAGRLSEPSLNRLIPRLAEEGLLTITHGDGQAGQLPDETLVELFMRQAAVVLRRETHLDGGDETWYSLRPRPHESFGLNYSQSVRTSRTETCELFAPLEGIIGGALEGSNWDDYVHLVAEQADNPALVSAIPRRVRADRGRRAGRGDGNTVKAAVIGNHVTSLSLATRPSTTAVGALSDLPPAALTHLMVDDIRVELPGQDKARSLPTIHDGTAPYWPDRLSRKKFWYAPVFEVNEPEVNADVDSSPFLFSFERVGVTQAGQPALRGEVRFTLRSTMSQNTREALRRDGHEDAQPVDLETLSASLLVPFVDTVDGQVKQHSFEAVVERDGDTLTATVPLLNEWVRLCYGALAVEGFQTSPAQVKVAYTFSGYVVVQEKDLELAFGGKALYTPVLYSAAEVATLRGTTYFDAATLTYVQPHAELRYQRKPTAGSARGERRVETVVLARPQLAASRPLVATTTAARPQLTVAPNIDPLLHKIKYAIRTQVRGQTQSFLFPCNRLGRFYQEMRDEVPAAIGCQDALTLGQTRYRQYEEITELRDAAYRVYRSLQQPGHFLIVPTRFCISRRAAGEADAFRPLVFLHALLDAEVAANNRVELRATLQPDLSPFKRRALKEQLKAYDPAPVLRYPTDIPTQEVTFNWALDPDIAATAEADTLDAGGPFIGTYFQMDLPSWQLMRRVLDSPGISGSVCFTLADGSELSASLLLKLDYIRGPLASGPLELTAGNGQVRLTNRIERTVDVSDLVRFAGSGVAEQVPVEVSLLPGETHVVTAEGELQPVYSYPPGDPLAIDEVRSFVEDIYSNLIFINLLNFANHNLIRLDVEACVQGVEGCHTTQLTEEMPVADIRIVLPLTRYLERHKLEFRVAKIFSDREAEMSDWMQWDLDTTVPVSITRELLGL